MPTAMITNPRLWNGGPHVAILENAGFEVRLPGPGVDILQPAVLKRLIADAEAVVAGTEPLTREVIQSAPRLRVIARSGVGYDSVDTAAADERQIAVTITPGTNEHSVAEHALAMILAVSRGFPERDRQVREGRSWAKRVLPRLAGRTLGIVGLGRIGKALAIRVPSLQLRVLAYEPVPDQAFVAANNIELVSMEELLKQSDIVTLHVPVTEQTRGLIRKETLALMKPGAILINTARGGLVIEQDLLEALTSGRIAAAGLDVFDQEPLPLTHPLLKLENVLLSPHAAGMDELSDYESKRMAGQVVADLYQGRWPAECIVNLKGVSRWKW